MTLKNVAANYNVDATKEGREFIINSIEEEIEAIEEYIEANSYDLYADRMHDCRKER